MGYAALKDEVFGAKRLSSLAELDEQCLSGLPLTKFMPASVVKHSSCTRRFQGRRHWWRSDHHPGLAALASPTNLCLTPARLCFLVGNRRGLTGSHLHSDSPDEVGDGRCCSACSVFGFPASAPKFHGTCPISCSHVMGEGFGYAESAVYIYLGTCLVFTFSSGMFQDVEVPIERTG